MLRLTCDGLDADDGFADGQVLVDVDLGWGGAVIEPKTTRKDCPYSTNMTCDL